MEINGNLPPTATLGLSTLKSLQWKVGQILQAVVVKQLTDQLALIKINNQPIEAQTAQKLMEGTRLKLQVETLTDKPVLKVLNQQIPAKAEPVLTQTIKQALPLQTSLLPLLANLSLISQAGQTKMPVPPALQVIAKEILDKLPTKDRIADPATVKQAVRNSGLFLENKLQTTAKILAQVVASSQPTSTPLSQQSTNQSISTGKAAPIPSAKLFQQAIEKVLSQELQPQQAKPVAEVKDDVKGLMLRLVNIIKTQTNTTEKPGTGEARATPVTPQTLTTTTLDSRHLLPPIQNKMPQAQKAEPPTLQNISNLLTLFQELSKQTEGSVARTQLHQIASMPTADANSVAWSIEIPIRNQDNIDLAHLLIEGKDESGNQKRDGKQWSVMIAVDLGELGPLHIKLQLENETISTTFWADKQETAQLVNQNLSNLKQRYESVGIESGNLQCYNAPPPDSPRKDIPMVVLDLNA